MIEDKLSHDERLRLEALSQAVAKNTMKPSSAEGIVYDASIFENYIREGK